MIPCNPRAFLVFAHIESINVQNFVFPVAYKTSHMINGELRPFSDIDEIVDGVFDDDLPLNEVEGVSIMLENELYFSAVPSQLLNFPLSNLDHPKFNHWT